MEVVLTMLGAALLLIAADGKHPYGFYMVLRLVITVGAVYWAWRVYKAGQRAWTWMFVAVALLLNPFLPIRMQRTQWQPIDLCLGILLIGWSGYWLVRKREDADKPVRLKRGNREDAMRRITCPANRCKDRIENQLPKRVDGLQRQWDAYRSGENSSLTLYFDYIVRRMLLGGRLVRFRYPTGWGAPYYDDFRFYCDPQFQPRRVEYWLVDHYDCAKLVLSGPREKLLLDIFVCLRECGVIAQSRG